VSTTAPDIWHTPAYRRSSRAIVLAARRNPLTHCWRCGLTLAEHPRHHTGARPFWTAGHLIDSDPRSPLAPEASTCNYPAGGRLGNARKRARRNPPSPNA
jgi:hypothetical protein